MFSLVNENKFFETNKAVLLYSENYLEEKAGHVFGRVKRSIDKGKLVS